MAAKFNYGIEELTVPKVMQLAHGIMIGEFTEQAMHQVQTCRSYVEAMVRREAPVYGINTGFGPLCDTQISNEETNKLQENLLISHAVGVGSPISKLLSKIMIICKVHALCKGYSGVRLEIIERLLFFIEKDLIPVVPSQGSVGASGDLAPLAHLFLPLIGEGEFWVEDSNQSAMKCLADLAIKPLNLRAKEGLALINGTQFILAHAILGLDKMAYLLDLADVAGTMSLEGAQGSASPFKAALHEVRPFDGSVLVAKRVRKLLEGSENLASHDNCERVQDPYSLRCIPQVHGASRNAWLHLNQLTTVELNAVTDNPIIVGDDEAISGGNFHGQPLAMALDYVTVAAAELGNISDRRNYLLLEGKYGLPRLLTKNEGLNSGMMIPQYTSAALVSENKSLCFPSSADSIPTSLGQEDHVSMGSISGRKFNQVLDNLEKILAIEFLYATQALFFRLPLTCSITIEKNLEIIRAEVQPLEEDRLLTQDIAKLIKMVRHRKLFTSLD